MENRQRPKIVALRTPADFRVANERRDEARIARGWDAMPLIDPKWPAGWWILPFAVGGLVETIVLVLWLSGYL